MLNIGDKVKMNGKYYVSEKNKEKIWTVQSEPWEVCGTVVVKLEGKSGGYAVDGLDLVEAAHDSAIEGLWDGCLVCMEAKHVHGVVTVVVPTCENRQEETMVEGDFDYCPICGRPLTLEAWEEMREKLEGMSDGD